VAKPTPDGPPATPPVQHLVVRYAKRGKMRFASHRDVARAFERGVRRAGVPIAHSAGFTPHPKISYAGGAPTGVASEAEYLSLALTSRSDPAAVRERLNAALPDGIEVIDVSEGAGGLPASQLVASEWQVILPGLPPRAVAPAVQEFLALEHAEVERLTSKGMRRMDARPAVVAIDLLASDSVSEESVFGNRASATLRMIVKHTVPAVRPDDVLTAMREISGVTPDAPPLMTRLAQGSISESGVVMP
jgi:radical SAM-linked protein